ncbi:MAG: hypothetical protein ACRDL7_00115 [Gaiellaceae bacterium]
MVMRIIRFNSDGKIQAAREQKIEVTAMRSVLRRGWVCEIIGVARMENHRIEITFREG